MNPTLLAREAAAELGALDPKPEPRPVFAGKTRLLRLVEPEAELFLDPSNGDVVTAHELELELSVSCET